MVVRAEVPEGIVHKNIREILKLKPPHTPKLPESGKEILKPKPAKGHLDPVYLKFKEGLKEKGTYYGWFYIWTGNYTWYWALETNCQTETGCTQNKPSCNTYADIHQEHPAWDNVYQRYVSIMFNAACANPDCGTFHLKPDYDNFPTSTGWYYYGVDFYPDFEDCVGQRYVVDGQAVVVYWPY